MNFFTIILFSALFTAVNAQKLPADLVVFNANVRTMDEKRPQARSIAVSGNKIIAVGKDSETKKLIGKHTKVIDAEGKLIIPGFNDSHVHFLGIGNQFFSINLRDVTAPQEAVEKIKYYVRFLPRGTWILGGLWNHENWTPNNLPAKELIDAATPENPVFIYHKDAKMVLVNSVALKLAGLDKNTKDIPAGTIVRDEKGEPTGILMDRAIQPVKKIVPQSPTGDKLAVIETATNYAASFGVTSVQDMSVDDNLRYFRELKQQGKLKTRIYDCQGLSDWQKLAGESIKHAAGDEMIRRGCLKSFSEGYEDMIPELYRDISAADKAGLQVMMHAIGSRANDIVLRIYERVTKENGARDRRFRIEHAHNFRDEDLPRFAASNIIASMQPYLFYGGEPYREILEKKAILAFGSDSSIIELNPLFGIYAAVKSTANGPEQAISVEEAVRAYTLGSAYAEFQEKIKGSITPGKLADFVILSDDIFTIEPEKIRRTKVLKTIFDGKVVYESSGITDFKLQISN